MKTKSEIMHRSSQVHYSGPIALLVNLERKRYEPKKIVRGGLTPTTFFPAANFWQA